MGKLLGGVLLAGVFALNFLIPAAFAQHGHGQGHGQGQRFDDPKRWAKSFDDPERSEWQKPGDVIAALGLAPDAKVADIGAGTGYFAVRLARAVPKGAVTAVDIEPNMVAYLTERARSLGLTNMTAIKGSESSPNLPEPVDLVIVVNTYHHIGDRLAYFKRLAGSLKPGGRIAIIDQNDKAPRGPPKHMRLSMETIDGEMKAAGYARIASHDFLPYQHFLVYGRAK